MRASKNGRPNPSAAKRRILAVGLALRILGVIAGAPHADHAATAPTAPVSRCSDFGCEQ
jgi:hypothetical protein